MLAIESRLCSMDEALKHGGDAPLTDTLVGSVFRALIRRIQEEGVERRQDVQLVDQSVSADPVPAIVGVLAGVVAVQAQENGYTDDEILGTIRTLNSSRVVWNEKGGLDDRGYIEFLQANFGDDAISSVDDLGIDRAEILTLAFAWYSKVEWLKVKAALGSQDDLDDEYETWLRGATRSVEELRERGYDVTETDIDASELITWCQARGQRPVVALRSEFAAYKAQRDAVAVGAPKEFTPIELRSEDHSL
jgi:hypothetical protein